jgi:integrase
MPSRAEIESVIEAVRGQNKRVSAEVSSMIAFMAYSGMRVSEVRAVNWEDIGDEWILVRGEGPDGPKNRDRRMVPICPPMADLLARLRWDGATGPVFRVKSPRFALENACERL